MRRLLTLVGAIIFVDTMFFAALTPLLPGYADDLDGAVGRVVGELLSSGPQAVREAKKLLRRLPIGVETAEIAARLRSSPEGQDGLRAFLERRKPDWVT